MAHVFDSSILLAAACAISLAGSGSAQPVNADPSGWVRIQRNRKTIEALVEGDGHRAVVVLPGLGGVQSMRALTTRVSRAGYRVITVRYRGMGNSTGELNRADLSAYVQVRESEAETLAAFRRLMAGTAVADESTVQLARMTLYSHTTNEAIIRSDLQLTEARKWPKADAALLRAIRSIRPGRWWEKITAPILAIHGTADKISPIENARATQKHAGSRIRLIEVEGAGHVLFSEHTERIATSIVKFLKEH